MCKGNCSVATSFCESGLNVKKFIAFAKYPRFLGRWQSKLEFQLDGIPSTDGKVAPMVTVSKTFQVGNSKFYKIIRLEDVGVN